MRPLQKTTNSQDTELWSTVLMEYKTAPLLKLREHYRRGGKNNVRVTGCLLSRTLTWGPKLTVAV